MADRPILFSAPMIRALLGGRKMQHRQPITRLSWRRSFGKISEFGRSDTNGYDWHFRDREKRWHDLRHEELLQLLPYHAGDRIWVKEGWRDVHPLQAQNRYSQPGRAGIPAGVDYLTIYRADGEYPPIWHQTIYPFRTLIPKDDIDAKYREGWEYGWTSAQDMPRWASRLTLEVTDVCVERLQDISEEDAIAEGVGPLCNPEGRPDLTWVGRPINCKAPSRAYKDLWDTLNAKRGHPWKQNPWVAAYTFRVIKSNIDEVSP